MAFNTPFAMPNMSQNAQGGWGYAGANVPYVDNATAVADKQGWNSSAAQGNLTRDTMRYGNGQIMHGMNTGFNGLGDQISDGFGSMADQAQYGGVYGNTQNRNFSPQSGNWGQGFGGSNPFMISSF